MPAEPSSEASYAATISTTCAVCGRAFSAELWLIVDAARPDLLDRLCDGKLHTVTCPHCGHEAELDAPGLVFRPHPLPRGPPPSRTGNTPPRWWACCGSGWATNGGTSGWRGCRWYPDPCCPWP